MSKLLGKTTAKPTKQDRAKLLLEEAYAELDGARSRLGAFRTQHYKLLEQLSKLEEDLQTEEAKVREIYKAHYEDLPTRFRDYKVKTTRDLNVELLAKLRPDLVDDGLIETVHRMPMNEFDKCCLENHIKDREIKEVITSKVSIVPAK